MHRSILSSGREAQAAKELVRPVSVLLVIAWLVSLANVLHAHLLQEELRSLRESEGSQITPFPEGTDLHSAQASR